MREILDEVLKVPASGKQTQSLSYFENGMWLYCVNMTIHKKNPKNTSVNIQIFETAAFV